MEKIHKTAFTLAETLITLMVIGVVAVMTIPTLMQQISDYTLAKQRDVFYKKFTEGLRQMRVAGKLEEKYDSTMAFVNEMQKYFKIASVCNSDNIAGCFTTQISVETRSLKANEMTTARYFSGSLGDYDSPVGLKMSDGTSMVIIYKKDCTGPAEGDVAGNLTECIGYIYDVNNKKSPNKMNSDVASNLPLYPYGLSFKILNNKVYKEGDCETATDGREVCYNGNSSSFCEAIGGEYMSWEQLEQMHYTVYDKGLLDIYYKASAGESVDIPNHIDIHNQPLMDFLGASQSGTYVMVHGNGSWQFYPDIQTILADLAGSDVNRIDVTICTVKE